MARTRVGFTVWLFAAVVFIAGTIWSPNESVVALTAVLAGAPIVAVVGAALWAFGLGSHWGDRGRTQRRRRLVAIGAVAGLALGYGLVAAGAISLIPDWAHGLTGIFGAGFAIGVTAFFCVPLSVIVGLVIGLLTALVWWRAWGRRMEPEVLDALDGDPYGVGA